MPPETGWLPLSVAKILLPRNSLLMEEVAIHEVFLQSQLSGGRAVCGRGGTWGSTFFLCLYNMVAQLAVILVCAPTECCLRLFLT